MERVIAYLCELAEMGFRGTLMVYLSSGKVNDIKRTDERLMGHEVAPQPVEREAIIARLRELADAGFDGSVTIELHGGQVTSLRDTSSVTFQYAELPMPSKPQRPAAAASEA